MAFVSEGEGECVVGAVVDGGGGGDGLRTTAALLASRDKMEYCIRTFTLSYENTNWKCFLIETACIN